MTDVETRLLAVSAVDGRYGGAVTELSPVLSEYGLIQRRVAVEAGWLATLGSGVLPGVEPLDVSAHGHLDRLVSDFDLRDAVAIKKIEKEKNHDVKAVEIWLRRMLVQDPSFDDYLELIHFGATSEDINNLAYAMQIRDTRNNVLQRGLGDIRQNLDEKAELYAGVPMLAWTHGQPATPTTLGKEMRVFAERLTAHQARLGALAIFGKFNGATGNYNALTVAYPGMNWQKITSRFVESFGFQVNTHTTQIEPHDWMAAILSETAEGNTILMDLARDMWTYISLGYYAQEVIPGEVGSSTMPNKVNPINFENAEGNIGLANALLYHLAQKLPVSRLQRDLSDSTSQRAFGEAFGHTVIAHKALMRGLGSVYANEALIASDLDKEWIILAEAVQTVMRRYGVPNAYEIIRDRTRGESLTREGYLALVESVDIPEVPKARLRELTPATYIGMAAELAAGP